MNEYSSLSELVAKSGKSVFLVAENIRSAYNVGAMFRTADGAGNCGIITVGYTPTPHNPKIPKTALGAECTIPWTHYESVESLYKDAVAIGAQQVGLEVDSRAVSLFDYKLSDTPALFYAGNEVTGLSLFLMTNLESFISLPMNGHKASLNVAEASSILIYELLRKSLV
jgi:tRNA G18 (ribose-2'-O)-methylase SpoU